MTPRPPSDPSRVSPLPLVLAVALGPFFATAVFALVLIALGSDPLGEAPRIAGVYLVFGLAMALAIGAPIALWRLRSHRAGFGAWGLWGSIGGAVGGAILCGWLLLGTGLGTYVAQPWRTGPLLLAAVTASALVSALGSRLVLALFVRRRASVPGDRSTARPG